MEEPKDSKQRKQLFGRPDQNTTLPWFKPEGGGAPSVHAISNARPSLTFRPMIDSTLIPAL